jgi:hypothetical protein
VDMTCCVWLISSCGLVAASNWSSDFRFRSNTGYLKVMRTLLFIVCLIMIYISNYWHIWDYLCKHQYGNSYAVL